MRAVVVMLWILTMIIIVTINVLDFKLRALELRIQQIEGRNPSP